MCIRDRSIRGSKDPNYLGGISKLFVQGSYCYAVSYDDAAFIVIDCADTKSPKIKAVLRGKGSPNYLKGAKDIFLDGKYAYVVSSFDDALVIINVASPEAPIVEGV